MPIVFKAAARGSKRTCIRQDGQSRSSLREHANRVQNLLQEQVNRIQSFTVPASRRVNSRIIVSLLFHDMMHTDYSRHVPLQ